MTEAVFTILSLSIIGSLLAGIIFLFKPLIKNKTSKAFSYYIWLVVLIRLCLPFGVSLPVPFGWLDERAQVATDTVTDTIRYTVQGSENTSDKTIQASLPMTKIRKDTSESVTSGDLPAKLTSSISENKSIFYKITSWLKSPLLWFIVLIAGAILRLTWQVFGYIRFAKLIKRFAKSPDDGDIAVFNEFCKNNRIRFLQSEYVRTPMMLGLIHPIVITPLVAYSKNGKAECLRDILRHELTHYRRKDMLYKWFTMIVTSLHWFNPLMIPVRREISRACELSCDEAVIRSLDQKQKQHYGETLLSMALPKQMLSMGILSNTMCEEKAQLKERLLFIKNYKPKAIAALPLSLAFMLILTACATVNGVGRQKTATPETATPTASQELQPLADNVTIFEKYGLKIAIPNEIIDKLVVITEPEQEIYKGTYLITVYEKRSFEAARAKFTDGYAGRIFSIVRYTQAQYEQFLSSDGSGQSFFARDDTYYYGWFIPTDLQLYYEGSLDPESAEYKEWLELNEKCTSIKDDFIACNKLTAYNDREFTSRNFTYDGNHISFKYYPYYEYNGSKDVVWTLTLSQPAKQGDKGIWCVERWKDEYDNLYYYFPDANGIPSSEYYAELQAECDAGKESIWLEPEQVALAFVREVFQHNHATLKSFERIDNADKP